MNPVAISKGVNLLSLLALYFAATGKGAEYEAVKELAQELNLSVSEVLALVAGLVGTVTAPVLSIGGLSKNVARSAKKFKEALGKLF